MLFRALFLLFLAVGLSVLATLYFGEKILFAIGLIAVQAKVIWVKLLGLKAPAIWTWLKTHLLVFFKKDVPWKWVSSVLLPLLFGNAIFRRIARLVGRYRAQVSAQFSRLMTWYGGLSPALKVIAALIILAATLAVAVSMVGLWLILFSVSLPLWIAAFLSTLGKSILAGAQKYLFKIIAFLQLRWLWRGVGKILPASWMDRKRRFDYRVARAVIRRRRMTVNQLAARKDRLPFRLGVMVEVLFLPVRPKQEEETS